MTDHYLQPRDRRPQSNRQTKKIIAVGLIDNYLLFHWHIGKSTLIELKKTPFNNLPRCFKTGTNANVCSHTRQVLINVNFLDYNMTKMSSFLIFIRRLLLIGFILWIVWLGFWVFAVPFNKYEWSETPMVDCDTNAEFVIALCILLICLSTVGILTWILIAKRFLGKNLETIALTFAITLSLYCVFKFYFLVEYSASIEKLCGSQ